LQHQNHRGQIQQMKEKKGDKDAEFPLAANDSTGTTSTSTTTTSSSGSRSM
jgi:hypothetical protein